MFSCFGTEKNNVMISYGEHQDLPEDEFKRTVDALLRLQGSPSESGRSIQQCICAVEITNPLAKAFSARSENNDGADINSFKVYLKSNESSYKCVIWPPKFVNFEHIYYDEGIFDRIVEAFEKACENKNLKTEDVITFCNLFLSRPVDVLRGPDLSEEDASNFEFQNETKNIVSEIIKAKSKGMKGYKKSSKNLLKGLTFCEFSEIFAVNSINQSARGTGGNYTLNRDVLLQFLFGQEMTLSDLILYFKSFSTDNFKEDTIINAHFLIQKKNPRIERANSKFDRDQFKYPTKSVEKLTATIRKMPDFSKISAAFEEVIQDENHFWNIVLEYNKMDDNGDGKISKSELESGVRSLNPSADERRIENLLKKFNKYLRTDGTLNFRQFVEIVKDYGDFSWPPSYQFYKHLVPSEEQFNTLFSSFHQIDEDNSQSLSIQEVSTLFKRIGHPQPKKVIQCMIQEFDVNGDGQIQFHEFLKLEKDAEKTDPEGAFKLVYDKDGNGFVDKEEFKAIAEDLLKKSLTDDMLELIMKEYDCNGDGKVDLDDYKAYSKKVDRKIWGDSQNQIEGNDKLIKTSSPIEVI